MKNIINSVLRSFGYYDLNGLKYSIYHLNHVMRRIPFYTRQHQAEYVDQVTKKEVSNSFTGLWFYNEVMSYPDDALCKEEKINTTAIGNLAYICLHHRDPNVRNKINVMLENYRTAMCKKINQGG